MITNREIIVVGQQPWDNELGSNCKNIALEFSRHNRVLYVNSPLDRITSMRDRKDVRVQKRLNVIKHREEALVPIQKNLWNLFPDCLVESVNWISVNSVFDQVNRYNAKKFAASIMKAVKELGFKNYILFNDNEIIKCFYLQELLKPEKSIYYSRDYILATPYWKKHGDRLERLVIASADVCVANSPHLTEYCRSYNRNAYYVGQGCELDIFQRPTVIPECMLTITEPIIGYIGALINNRLDISILEYIAEQRPDWNIVLVGPEDEGFKQSSLHKFSNVHFTGAKTVKELPAFLQSFDVCINPQLVNELTVGNYPRKIDEYLSMGKPVVATRTSAMKIFEDHVWLCDTKEEYVELIEQALTEISLEFQQERKDFSATHTWENSVAEIYKAIESVSERKSVLST